MRTLSAVLWQWSCVNRAKHDKHHCAAFVAICEGIAKQDIAPHLTWISRLVLREDAPEERRYIAQPSKIPGRPIFKQEKGGGVAVHPSAGSQRPATPVVSRDSGILSAKSR